jgi:Protein of unknown function (DUF4242)
VTRFLVEAYTPESTPMAEIERQAAEIEQKAHLTASKAASPTRPIRYMHSIFIREDETSFHLFEALSAEVVRAATERAGLRLQRIVEASTNEDMAHDPH